MTKSRLFIAALLGVVILTGMVLYIPMLTKGKPPAKNPAQGKEQDKGKGDVKFEVLKRQSLKEGWGRNPFFMVEDKAPVPIKPVPIKEVKAAPAQPTSPPKLPPQEKEKEVPLRLEMLLMIDDKMIAILNGQSVKEGDKVGEEVVAKIDSDRVLLKKNGQQRTIKLDPFSIPFQVEKRRP